MGGWGIWKRERVKVVVGWSRRTIRNRESTVESSG